MMTASDVDGVRDNVQRRRISTAAELYGTLNRAGHTATARTGGRMFLQHADVRREMSGFNCYG